MRRIILPLFLCILLCSCGTRSAQTQHRSHPFYPQEGIYISDSEIEQSPSRTLLEYALPLSDNPQMLWLDDSLIMVDRVEKSLILSKLIGEVLSPAGECTYTVPWDASSGNVRLENDRIAVFSTDAKKYLLLDSTLKETGSIALPENCRTPFLSSNRKDLFFCTNNAVMAKNIDSGLVRTIYEFSDSEPFLHGLARNDSFLLCSTENERYSLIDTVDGHIISQLNSDASIFSDSEKIMIAHKLDPVETVLYGEQLDTLQELTPPAGSRVLACLLQQDAVVTCRDSSGLLLELYDLNTGKCISSFCSADLSAPQNTCVSPDGSVYLICKKTSTGKNILIRWNPSASPFTDDTIYTGPRFSPGSPDHLGLLHCNGIAEKITEDYGVTINLWQNAIAVQPAEYVFNPEYRIPLIQQSLDTIEVCLSHFPPEFWQSLKDYRMSIQICLVQKAEEKAESENTDCPRAFQYQIDGNWYIVLTPSPDLEHTLYHQLTHIIDTVVINHFNYYDDWEKMNPQGFKYNYDLQKKLVNTNIPWLQDETRCFADTYSMSFPVEERAQIMEYAITPDHEYLFQSDTMQEKLRVFCVGIRKAFNLAKSREIYPWEQYLWHSLSSRN